MKGFSRVACKVLRIAASLLVDADQISQQNGLLSNDALLVAVMQAHGLTKLASNEPPFASGHFAMAGYVR